MMSLATKASRHCRLLRIAPRVEASYRLQRTRVALGGIPTRSFSTEDQSNDRSVSIQDVHIASPPQGSGRSDLVPSSDHLRLLEMLPPSFISHLRWMLQKDLALCQDFCFLGPPELARDRRSLLFLYAALVEREIEYVSLSRDTSDADLKQRREVIEGGNSIYVPQAPVRAALEGRLLILDGLEKAERNVLPTLNNLLENRELSLDDGSMLVSPTVYDSHDEAHLSNIHRVHPDFRVAALGSLQGGSTLDPPLRSRFQARIQTQADPGELMEALANAADGQLDEATLQNLVYMATATDTPTLSLESLSDAAQYLVQYNKHINTDAALNAHGMGFIGSDDIVQPFDNVRDPVSHSSSFVSTLRSESIMNLIDSGLENGKAVVCVGPKGCGKSAIAIEAARRSGTPAELFSLYKDMMSRDLLVTRGTDEAGNTIWRKTPLTRAVENGTCVILDGIDKLGSDTLSSIARLLEHREVDLPDGTRLKAHPGFACIALAHPPESKRSKSWITPEVSGMFFWCDVEPLPADEMKLVLAGMFPDLDPAQLDKIISLRDRLESAIASGAADTMDEQESLMLSLRKMKHICRRLERKGNRSNLPQLVRDALMTSLMPDREQQIVETCMTDCGIVSQSNDAMYDDTVTELDEELLAECRRTPAHPLLVPSPRFEDNPGHTKILGDLLDAHSVGERALLVMGWQGVGKNRVVDSLLNRLQCEREYLQLHRDTTVQSLLSSPSVEDGRLVFKDSPLVRAALNGRILVVDEADKAPIEVVALLKGLIEDGELCLPDGRVLRYEEATSDAPGQTSIAIHPDFRVWALANPAGYPFHGNNLAKEMADVFSCHTVPALDPESQGNILKSYGPNLPDETIQKIIRIWQDLSKAHERGILAYPFSIREAVGVVRHLEKYPDDGFATAIDNVLAFDRFDTTLMKQLNSIFNQHGVKLQIPSTKLEGAGREGGISTPRTRALDPKHGKIDPTGNPHVGGNTWAGGTGGSDTAGLGGRGGPYRLDLGHKVHQVSDEMKAQVSEESLRRAKEMGERALEEKLKELNMGKLDWERYDSLRQRVDIQIQQLQVLLKDIKRRKDERVWLRRQSTGELDDSRIVDAIAGEKDVFKRRGIANEAPNHGLDNDENMFVTLVVDVSASMYRFNSYDGRLERLLEATLMIMEALGDDKRFKLQIVGHNGSSAQIPLAKPDTSKDPATQLKILEEMIAHTQFTWAGDSTLEAIELAVNNAHEDELILIISDANLKRYRIEPEQVSMLLQRSDVHAHLVLVGSMGEEASDLASEIANGRAQVCSDSEELPLLMKNILASVTR